MASHDSNKLDNLRVILIGGSSNAGKSTLAEFMAAKLGWHYVATDYLARHPGRPWRTPEKPVPPHVAEHYLSLPVDELIVDVLAHYKRLWPTIEATVRKHATDDTTERLIIEGSALWPESVATLNLDNVATVWLTASDNLFCTRIYNASRFDETNPEEKMMIQKFLDRTLGYNERMMAAVNRLGLNSINVETSSSLDELSDTILKLRKEPL